jgi:tetratricopeptide (TPR) repeat protein
MKILPLSIGLTLLLSLPITAFSQQAKKENREKWGLNTKDLKTLGRSYERQNELDSAITWGEIRLSVAERDFYNKKEHADALFNIGKLYKQKGWYTYAENNLKQAAEMRRQLYGPTHVLYQEALQSLARLHELNMAYPEAEAIYQQLANITQFNMGNPSGVDELLPTTRERNKTAGKGTKGGKSINDPTESLVPSIIVTEPFQSQLTRGQELLEIGYYTIAGVAFVLNGNITKVTVNDQEVFYGKNGSWRKSVELLEGENLFVIKAESNRGGVATDTVKLIYTGPEHEATNAKNHLLVVAINRYYDNNWPDLAMPIKDAMDVYNILTERFEFDPAYTDTIFNENATLRTVNQKMRTLVEKAGPDDNVIIYFAGHGHFDQILNEGYWVLADGEQSNAAISVVLRAFKAKHVLVIADACFSGSLYLGDSRGEEVNKNAYFRSRWVFTSGRLEPVSDRLQSQYNSPFAHYLLEYLKKAKQDVWVSQMADFVKRAVNGIADQNPIAGPIRGDEGGEFVLKLKK